MRPLDLSSFKNRLKSVPIINALNQLLKCISLRSFHAINRVRYSAKLRIIGSSYSRTHVITEVQFSVRERGLGNRISAGTKPRMLWIGALENQDRGGLLQALQSHFEVEIFKNSHDGYGLLGVGPVPVDYNAEKVRRLNVDVLSGYLGANWSDPKFDVLFGQMWAPLLNPAILSTAQARGVFVVNIAMDDVLPIHWITRNGIRNGAIGLSPGVDLTLTTREECPPYYLAEGALALHWNLGSSSDFFGKLTPP